MDDTKAQELRDRIEELKSQIRAEEEAHRAQQRLDETVRKTISSPAFLEEQNQMRRVVERITNPKGQLVELERQLAVLEGRAPTPEPPNRLSPAPSFPPTKALPIEKPTPRPTPSKKATKIKAGPLQKRAAWLKKKLDGHGWGANAFEEQGGCDHKTTAKVLLGQKVQRAVLDRIANALGVDTDEIPSA
jgi:hypothetical protein